MTAATAPRRILILGTSGSGKSTLARRLSERLSIPCHLIDEIVWRPGWVLAPAEEQRSCFAEVCAGESWILDHASSSWIDLPFERADLIVGLDYPRWLSLRRLLPRTFIRILTKAPICNGNVETWSMLFSRESILVWHFTTFRRRQERMRAWAKSPEAPETMLFRWPRELEQWFDSLPR